MLVDLNFKGKYVVMVGGGSESYRKTLSFLEAGAKILVVSKAFSLGIKKLHTTGKVELLKKEVKEAEDFVKSLKPKPDLLVAVTNSHRLNAQLIIHAKAMGCMVYSVDDPSMSDFILPAIAKLSEVRIAISTSGKSPAMARVLRQRIEKMVTEEDLQQIRLQTYAREILKQRVPNHRVRRQILYRLLKNEQINQLLKNGKINEAQRLAAKLVEVWIQLRSEKKAVKLQGAQTS